jgi:hypothetical protein
VKTIIRLRDLASLPIHHGDEWASHIVREARTALERADLRFNNRNGRMLLHDETVERFKDESHFCPHPDTDAVMRWEFSRHITNACSRITRGHPAI